MLNERQGRPGWASLLYARSTSGSIPGVLRPPSLSKGPLPEPVQGEPVGALGLLPLPEPVEGKPVRALSLSNGRALSLSIGITAPWVVEGSESPRQRLNAFVAGSDSRGAVDGAEGLQEQGVAEPAVAQDLTCETGASPGKFRG